MADYTSFQAGARLMAAAMAGAAERVPVYAQLHDFAAHELGIPGREFYTRPELRVPAILEIEARYGIDIASVTYDVYNIEAEGLGQKLVFGVGDIPDIDRSQPLIREASDLGLVRRPDFDTAGRFTQVILMQELYRDLTGLTPGISFCAPFSLAANLYGIERLLMAVYTEPAFARGLLERVTEEVLAPWIEYQLGYFPETTSICGADAVASVPVVNIEILRAWAAPPILRLREIFGPRLHVDNWVGEARLKKPEEMLKLKQSVTSDLIQGQDPDVELLSPAFYKRYAQENEVALILGVGANFMAQAEPEAVTRRVRQYLEAGKPGGRFALYLCNIGANTPPENVRAAVEAVRAFGR